MNEYFVRRSESLRISLIHLMLLLFHLKQGCICIALHLHHIITTVSVKYSVTFSGSQRNRCLTKCVRKLQGSRTEWLQIYLAHISMNFHFLLLNSVPLRKVYTQPPHVRPALALLFAERQTYFVTFI